MLKSLALFSYYFFATLILGRFLLPRIERMALGQQVRDDGPSSHLKKSGTPTFGGLFFLIPYVLGLLILPQIFYLDAAALRQFWAVGGLSLGYGLVGFMDDFVKVRVTKEGITALQKTVPMLLVTLVFALYYLWFSGAPVEVLWPFGLGTWVIQGWWKFVYLPFVLLYLYFMANAVNLSDGLDGLCASLSFFTAFFFFLSLLRLQEGAGGSAWTAIFLMGGTAGFLIYNGHPAKIFMGDVGSQSLGAALGGMALMAGLPWLLLLQAGVQIAVGLSSVMQVLYFRMTGGKRLFRMAPLHHHFELLGWKEVTVVRRFRAAALVLGLLGLCVMW